MQKTKENYVLFNNTFFSPRNKFCLYNDKKIISAAVCNAIELINIKNKIKN